MKTLLLIILVTNILATESVKLEDRYSTSKNCKACHNHILKDFKKSWHARSHITKNEYYKKSIEYIARKSRGKSFEMVEVECAKCHNPRISKTKTSEDDSLRYLMNLKNKTIDDATNDQKLTEGINCLVCHNIDNIHNDKDESIRGMDRVDWVKSGMMSGPYDNAKSPYHKVEKRNFMKEDVNNLCFVCHANKRSNLGVEIANMKKEYNSVKGKKKLCVDCHMSASHKGIAARFIQNGKTTFTSRIVRNHTFKGAHYSDMLKGSLGLEISVVNETLLVIIKNDLPHNVPSGMGARELVLEIIEDNKKRLVLLSSTYFNKRDKLSIPLCVKNIKDPVSYIKAKSTKKMSFKIAKGVYKVSVNLYYKLVNDQVNKVLKLEDKKWNKLNLIASQKVRIR